MINKDNVLFDNTENNPLLKKKNREKTINMAISVSILSISVLIFIFVLFIKPESGSDINQDTYNSYMSFDNSLISIETDYLNSNGYVKSKKVKPLLDAVEKELKQGIGAGIVDSYNREKDNIYIRYTCGIQSVFVPHRKNMLSSGKNSKILCIEPEITNNRVDVNYFKKYLKNKFKKVKYTGAYSVSANVRTLQKNKKNSTKASLVNSQVSIDNLKNLGKEGIIIFEGHGVYNKITDSCLVTGQEVVKWDDIEKYSDDLADGNIIMTSYPEKDEGNNKYRNVTLFTVTSKFFDKYLNNMKDTLVFLGACYSVKSDALSNSFLSKGAAAVVGYSNSISLEYELLTRTMFFNNLCKSKKATVTKALNGVKRVTMDFDPWSNKNAKLNCISRDNLDDLYTLNGMLKVEDVTNENQGTTTPTSSATVNNRNNRYSNNNNSAAVYTDAPNSTTATVSPEQNYRSSLIKEVMRNEAVWNVQKSYSDTSYYPEKFSFIDLNNNGYLEFVVRYISSDGNDSFTDVYNFSSNTFTYITANMDEKFDFLSDASKPYYNIKKGKYMFLGRRIDDNLTENYLAYYAYGEVIVDTYSSCEYSVDESNNSTYTYYDGSTSYSDTKEITQYEYDTINSNIKGQLRDAVIESYVISLYQWGSSSNSEKEALLINSYDSFSIS